MCGLVGVAGEVSAREEKIYRELLLISSLRGTHSTGTAFINRNNNIEPILAKGIGGPWNLLTHKTFKKGMSHLNKVLIGHNRFATVGSVDRNNAHPFENERVIGAHNGTLTNRKLLPDYEKFPVDSENIFHSFLVQGEKETIKNLEGSFALVWWDKKEKKLKFIRNERRELYYAYNKMKTILFWASEKQMLEFILTRNNFVYDKIYIFNTKNKYTFEFPNVHPKKIKVKQEEMEFYVKVIPPYNPSYNYDRHYSESYEGTWFGKIYEDYLGNTHKEEIKNSSAKIGSVRWKGGRDPSGSYSLNKNMRKKIAKGSIPKKVKGPEHTLFDKQAFDTYVLIRAGCCWCSSVPEYGDDIRYLDNEEYLCADCKNNPEILQYT